MRILGAVLFPLILLAPAAEAQKKAGAPADPKKKIEYTKGPVGKAPAPCGAKILPLIEGNQWKYEYVESGVAPREDMLKLSPSQPMEIIITVKSVEPRGTETLITLEEKSKADLSKDPKKHIYDERTLTSTITCSKTKFEISPESFFFAGEPAGHFGLAFDKLERSRDTSWKLVNGAIGEGQWREDIVAHFTRTSFPGSGAKLESGKLEMERTFTPQQPESINTKVGLYTGAEHIALVTTGRVTLDHPVSESKLLDLPAGWLNQLWLVPNVGVVQVLNAYAHKYILAGATLK